MIIGLTGAICAGKTELAKYLMQTYGFEAINLLEMFKLRLKKERDEAKQAKRLKKQQTKEKKETKQGQNAANTEEESKDEEAIEADDEFDEEALGIGPGNSSFCHAFYQAEFKELREKIIKEVFRDMTSNWNRHFVIYPLSPCDNIKLML